MQSITTAFIFHDDKLLVVLHKKLGKWMHVGGHTEEGEFPDESLLREIKEETGLDVEILGEKPLPEGEHVFPQTTPFCIHGAEKKDRILIFDYICKAKDADVKLQEEELLEHRWIKEEEIDGLDMPPLLKILSHKAFRSLPHPPLK